MQRAQNPWRACKISRHSERRIVPLIEIQANSRLNLGRYKVCTNSSNTPTRSWRYGEFKNVILLSVQRAHKPWRACKVGRHSERCVVPSMEIQENSRLNVGRYKVCTNASDTPKGSWGHGEFKNVIPLSVQRVHKPWRACKMGSHPNTVLWRQRKFRQIRA